MDTHITYELPIFQGIAPLLDEDFDILTVEVSALCPCRHECY